MKGVTPAWLAAWWAGLWLLWLLFVGTWTPQDATGGAVAALAATGAAYLVRRFGSPASTVRFADLRPALSVPRAIVVDFAIVARELVHRLRGRPPRSSFRRSADGPLGDDARSAARRALVETLATFSPNAYVVDATADGRVLLHDLVVRRSSERPA